MDIIEKRSCPFVLVGKRNIGHLLSPQEIDLAMAEVSCPEAFRSFVLSKKHGSNPVEGEPLLERMERDIKEAF
jgi:hypothetical protein